MDITFKHKVAVVTGAASGMGQAIAESFAALGGTVILVDKERNAVELAANEIVSMGGNAVAIAADLRVKAEIEGFMEVAISEHSRIDLLVNSAFAHPKGFSPCLTEDLSDDHWYDTSKLALDAVFFATRAALPVMRKQVAGTIINMSSISGLAGDRGGIAYNTMKAAVINFSRVIALEYAEYGVRCNSITPGVIQTPLIAALDAFPSWKADLISSVPLARAGTAEEIANLVVFLASDHASFITGSNFVIDGGHTAGTGVPSPLKVQPSQFAAG